MNASRGVEESVNDLMILRPMAEIAFGSCSMNSVMVKIVWMIIDKGRGDQEKRYNQLKYIYTVKTIFSPRRPHLQSVIHLHVSGHSPSLGHSSTWPLY